MPPSYRTADVSVCIAHWNCRDLLRNCLAALHEQPQDLLVEIIVIDNASTDGSADMVAQEFPQVIVQRNLANVGFARANNQAAGRARGRFLFFLNNDTVVPAGALRRLVDFAEAHPEIGIIGPRLRDGSGRVQVSYRPRPTVATFLNRLGLVRWTGLLRRGYRHYRRQDFDPDSTRPVEVLMGAAMLVPRAVFFSCGGWDEGFSFGGEDLDLCYRVRLRHQVVYYPAVEITHFGRASTRQCIGPAAAHIQMGFVRYLRKSGSSRLALLLYKLLVGLNAPVEFCTRYIQYVYRRARKRSAAAQKSLLVARGLGYFLLKGFIPFWKA